MIVIYFGSTSFHFTCYCFFGLLVPEAIDFESPLRTFRVLSSTTIPLPEDDRRFLVSTIFLLRIASVRFNVFLLLQEFATMQSMNRWCDRRRCFSNRPSTVFFSASEAAFFLAMCSSMSLRSWVFSSRKTSKDCSRSEVRDFLRNRLFFACLRFRSLLTKKKSLREINE